MAYTKRTSDDRAAPSSPRANLKEQDLRRLRGEISCAECRRLKLKCDRKVPCSSCNRRGCPSICPTGTFIGGQNSRQLAGELTSMQRKLNEMGDRIRHLENALRTCYAQLSRDPHPLLAEDLLRVKENTEPVRSDAGDDEKQDVLDVETMEAFGKLSLSEEAAELLHLPSNTPLPEIIEKTMYNSFSYATLPPEVRDMAFTWPFAPMPLADADFRTYVARFLPTWERATALCEAYLENMAWFYKGIERDHLMEELMPAVYGKGSKLGNGAMVNGDGGGTSTGTSTTQLNVTFCPMDVFLNGRSPDAHSPPSPIPTLHQLCLLLSIFAIGATADFTQPQYNAEAETFFHLARAGLGIHNVFDEDIDMVSLELVQCVSMLGLYCKFSARKGNFETASLYMNLAYVLASTISLHRDPDRWKLPAKIMHRRRGLFWELFTVNNWHSISFGRPAVFCLHSTDCEFPEDKDARKGADGRQIVGFWRWKYMFGKEVLGPISEQMCVASPMKYSTILDMDRRIREFHAQHARSPRMDTVMGEWDFSEVMQGLMSQSFTEMVSLVLHRNFFAKALLDKPSDPLSSPFSPSFLGAYRSATEVMRILREQYEQRPKLMERMWLVRGHSLSAIIIIASVVMHLPTSELGQSAFVELGLAMTLYDKMASHPMVRQALPLILKLFEKAQRALYSHDKNASTLSTLGPSPADTASSIFASNGFDPSAMSQQQTTPCSSPASASASASTSNCSPHALPTLPEQSWTSTTSVCTNPSTNGCMPNPNPNSSCDMSLLTGANFCDAFDTETINQVLASMDVDLGVGLDATWRAFVGEQGFGSGYSDINQF